MPDGSINFQTRWGSEDTWLPPSHSQKGGPAACLRPLGAGEVRQQPGFRVVLTVIAISDKSRSWTWEAEG